jgi:hypothetical protein
MLNPIRPSFIYIGVGFVIYYISMLSSNSWRYTIVIFSVLVIFVFIHVNISSSFARNYDVLVEKFNNRVQVKKNNELVYNGTNATYGIEIGITKLEPGQHMYISNGTYTIIKPLRLGNYSYLEGVGNKTIFDYSQIGNQHALIMGVGSHLGNIKFVGSITPLPNDFTQGILANNDTVIENISISHMGYGISTNNSNSVTLRNIRCEFVQSKSDWAACIHGGEKTTTNLYIDKFTVADSNRAVELDATARNIIAQNGYLIRIKNFNHSGHEAFTLDVHDHIGSGQSTNITYRNVYMKDSYAPTTKESALTDHEHSGDYKPNLPMNILYQNITVVNPTSSWQVGGIGITIQDSHVINSTRSTFVLYKNSKNILIKNTSAFVRDNNSFVRLNNTLQDTGLQNISIIQNRITDYPNKTNSTMSFQNINGLILKGNTITNAPIRIPAIDTKGNRNLIGCDNYITFVNGIHETWPAVCMPNLNTHLKCSISPATR